MSFEKIIKSEIVNYHIEKRVCPDQHIGKIRLKKGIITNPKGNSKKNDFDIRTDIKNYIRSSNPIIIMIIESPHKIGIQE